MKVHELQARLNYCDPHADVGIVVDIPDWEVEVSGPLIQTSYDPNQNVVRLFTTDTEGTHQ